MLARWREDKRGVAIVLAAGLAATALAAVLAAVAMARPLGFLHLRSNLSQTATFISAYPDLAVSPDGDRVVAAWTEGYKDGVGYKGHVYLRVASEAGAGWGGKIPVFSGGDSVCAYDVAVAVTGTTAHVAYVVFNNTCSDPTQMQVRYRTCSLASGQCDGSEDVVASADTLFNRITWVDLAVDASGNPHVVWARYDEQGHDGEILYSARAGGTWGSLYTVGSNAGGKNNNAPAITWADGSVHVVWEEETLVGEEKTEHVLRYRRRRASGWESSVYITPLGSDTKRPPSNPDVAAGAGEVFVVWDWCSNEGPNSPCSTYHMVYRRSNSGGVYWGTHDNEIREVGTDYRRSYRYDDLGDYDSVLEGQDEYVRRLRPAIALNEDGWPAVVWHAKRNGGGGEEGGGGGESYVIYYSYAISGTDSAVDWITTTVLNEEQPSWLGSAAVSVGVRDGEQRLHAAYMRKPSKDSADAWDVYYEGFSYNPQARIHVAGLVLVSSTVTLDGSGSYDPLGFPLTYDWSLIGRPPGSVAALSDPSAVSPTITVDVIGYYTVTLEVDNGLMTSPLATQTILACETIYGAYLPLVLRGGL